MNPPFTSSSVKILTNLVDVVAEAGDGDEALKILKSIGPFDLLLSDVILPGSLKGLELEALVPAIDPGPVPEHIV